MADIAEVATVKTELIDRVFCIEMHRPAKKNALNSEMYAALIESFKRAENDPNSSVIFFHGGPHCFTSGSDLGEFMAFQKSSENRAGEDFLHTISQAEKPIVAAVAGPAVGIGSTMLLHCDIVLAATSAAFHFPFVNLGLCPEAGSSFLLPRLVGHNKAAELFLLAESFGADRALALGLVNSVFPESDLLKEGLKIAQKMAAKPLPSLLLTKALLKKDFAERTQDRIQVEGRHFSERLVSPEAKEAFAEFFERRKQAARENR